MKGFASTRKTVFFCVLSAVITTALLAVLFSGMQVAQDSSIWNIVLSCAGAIGGLAEVVVAICAIIALKQLGISRSAIQAENDRCAADKAVQQCRVFKDEILEQQFQINKYFQEHEITPYNSGLVTKDIVEYLNKWAEQIIRDDLVVLSSDLLNSLEMHALLVKEGIASEEILYYPTCVAFLSSCKCVIPFMFLIKHKNNNLYSNLCYVFERWSKREQKENLRKRIAEYTKQYNSLS